MGRIRHQMARAIAHLHLFVFATLHQTRTVAVEIVHVENVFIAVATVSLLHTNVTCQWIILDVFN